MNVGVVGLGKLGLPVAVAMASRDIEVYGYDVRPPDFSGAKEHEWGFEECYERGRERLHIVPLAEVVAKCDVIFLAVQTPHEPRFEGVTPIPEDRADFDYSFLTQAVFEISGEAERQRRSLTLAVISTVLPGTMAREVKPLLPPGVSLAYNPSFIAMGTTIRDFLEPEFILIGGNSEPVKKVYAEAVNHLRFYETTVANAELIKVSYNTFIGMKLAFANTVMEVCHKTDCDVDEVMGALKQANRRLISGAYMDGGMGDGGGCHPRDNIALSWLARELDLSHDLFDDIMRCREDQAEWLARMLYETATERNLPIGILGIAYKPGSHIETGSPAMLVKILLHDRLGLPWKNGRVYDPHTEEFHDSRTFPEEPHVWLVGCKHPEFPEMQFPPGTVILDPWRYIPDQAGVEVIRIG